MAIVRGYLPKATRCCNSAGHFSVRMLNHCRKSLYVFPEKVLFRQIATAAGSGSTTGHHDEGGGGGGGNKTRYDRMCVAAVFVAPLLVCWATETMWETMAPYVLDIRADFCPNEKIKKLNDGLQTMETKLGKLDAEISALDDAFAKSVKSTTSRNRSVVDVDNKKS